MLKISKTIRLIGKTCFISTPNEKHHHITKISNHIAQNIAKNCYILDNNLPLL